MSNTEYPWVSLFQSTVNMNCHGRSLAEDDEDQELISDPHFEFDAPKFCDFLELQNQIKKEGKLAFEESTEEKAKNQRWFQQTHLNHEPEEATVAVNLLLIPEDSEEQEEIEEPPHDEEFMANYAAGFWNELSATDDENENFEIHDAPALPDYHMMKPALRKRITMKISQLAQDEFGSINSSSVVDLTDGFAKMSTGSDVDVHSLYRNWIKKRSSNAGIKAKPARVKPAQETVYRNITRRREKENESFIIEQDVHDHSWTRSHGSVLAIPESGFEREKAVKKEQKKTNAMKEDLKALLATLNQSAKNIRSAQHQQTKGKLAPKDLIRSTSSDHKSTATTRATLTSTKPKMTRTSSAVPEPVYRKPHSSSLKTESAKNSSETTKKSTMTTARVSVSQPPSSMPSKAPEYVSKTKTSVSAKTSMKISTQKENRSQQSDSDAILSLLKQHNASLKRQR